MIRVMGTTRIDVANFLATSSEERNVILVHTINEILTRLDNNDKSNQDLHWAIDKASEIEKTPLDLSKAYKEGDRVEVEYQWSNCSYCGATHVCTKQPQIKSPD